MTDFPPAPYPHFIQTASCGKEEEDAKHGKEENHSTFSHIESDHYSHDARQLTNPSHKPIPLY